MRWPLLLVTLIAGLFTACGGGSNDKAEIEEAATAFFQALTDDPPTAYTYLSQNCKDQMPFPRLPHAAPVPARARPCREGLVECHQCTERVHQIDKTRSV